MKKELANQVGQCLSDMLKKKAEYIILRQLSARVMIEEKAFLPLEKMKGKGAFPVSFVDGGNAEVLGSSTFSLQLIRLGAVLFQGKKRMKSVRKQFFVLVSLHGEHYQTEIFGDTLFTPLTFSLSEQSLKMGNDDVAPASIGNAFRRYAELAFAAELMKKEDSSLLVLDGSLALRYPHEEEFFSGLADVSKEKNIPLLFLSKSTSTCCDNNLPASYCLLERLPGKAWLYPCGTYPDSSLKNGTRYEVSFVHLHPDSSFVFMAEYIGQGKEVLSSLLEHSSDPAFLGYPYGLVVADGLARIPHEETKQLASYLTATMKNTKELHLLLKNTHSVLDSMRF